MYNERHNKSDFETCLEQLKKPDLSKEWSKC